MYLCMFIFSITLYHSQRNYIELYTEKVKWNNGRIDQWAFGMLYIGVVGGLGVFYVSSNKKD
jgi:hypothetical protein